MNTRRCANCETVLNVDGFQREDVVICSHCLWRQTASSMKAVPSRPDQACIDPLSLDAEIRRRQVLMRLLRRLRARQPGANRLPHPDEGLSDEE